MSLAALMKASGPSPDFTRNQLLSAISSSPLADRLDPHTVVNTLNNRPIRLINEDAPLIREAIA